MTMIVIIKSIVITRTWSMSSSNLNTIAAEIRPDTVSFQSGSEDTNGFGTKSGR